MRVVVCRFHDILAAALDKCDARSLVVEINGDAKHRSHITSFTSDHALLQTLTIFRDDPGVVVEGEVVETY